ncbi:LuxR C-terminal-related transcriptional regulator [Streptomyces sp. NPDC002285]
MPGGTLVSIPSQGNVRGRWPLTGREGELAALKQAWATRACRGLVICGPAGVGKTRLAEECLAFAAREGWQPGRATASTAAGTVPLGAIAHMLPVGVDLSDPVKGFAQVAAALADGPNRRRWAFWVDDLHLLDATSAMLLRQLLDASVIRLIATVRAGGPVGDAVNALTHGDAVHRIDLDPFDQERVERLLEAALGGPVGRRTVHTLFRASGGNALYLRELVQGSLDAKTMTSDGGIWELAEGALTATPRLTELISTRLASASPAGRRALELLALCEPLPLAHAEAEASPQALAELEEAGLIHILHDRRRITVTLAHSLYEEVLRAGLPVRRRRLLLLEQAARVEAHGARRRDDTLDIATWHLAATGTADPALLTRAAALARHAHDYRQVTTLLQALPNQHHTTASRLLLGESRMSLQEFDAAETALAHAKETATTEAERISIVYARAQNFLMSGCLADAVNVSVAGREHAESELGKQALQIIEGAVRCLAGEPARGKDLLEASTMLEQDADSGPDLDIWLFGTNIKALTLSRFGQTSRAIRFARKAYATHLQVDKEARYLHPAIHRVVLVNALAEAGNLSEARSTGLEAISRTVTDKAPVPYLWGTLFLGRSQLIAGHLEEARELYAEAVAEAKNQDAMLAIRLAESGLAAAAAQLGDLDTAQAIITGGSRQPMFGPFIGEEYLGEAWLHAAQGDLGRARLVLVEGATSARDAGIVASEALLLTDVARLGGAKEVGDRLAELARQGDGALAATRAHLAAALAAGDPNQLLDAAVELEAIGADLLAAEAATAAAIAWRRVGQARRATAATTRAEACAVRCPGAHTPLLRTVEATAPLTSREREIALLAAAGTASRDIAATLHLSVRTVDNHLQHAYAKLGVTTRRELAEALGTTPARPRAATPDR